jgi:hypothetical protein
MRNKPKKLLRKLITITLFAGGGLLFYLGWYAYKGENFNGWQVWVPGAVLIVAAVAFNRKLFSRKKSSRLFQCGECGFRYREEAWAEKCEAWCREHNSCNLEITSHAEHG